MGGAFLDIGAGEFSEATILDVERSVISIFRLSRNFCDRFGWLWKGHFAYFCGRVEFTLVSTLVSELFGDPTGTSRCAA